MQHSVSDTRLDKSSGSDDRNCNVSIISEPLCLQGVAEFRLQPLEIRFLSFLLLSSSPVFWGLTWFMALIAVLVVPDLELFLVLVVLGPRQLLVLVVLGPNQWRNEGAGEGGHPQAQPKEGAQKTEVWGKYSVGPKRGQIL